MRRRFTAWCLIILLVASLFAFEARPAESAPASADPIDVVMLIDSSGSMSKSDPGQLNLTASHMLIDLLSPGDRVSLVDFDSKASVIAPLTAVSSQADRDALSAKLSAITAVGSTDYAAALSAARAQLAGDQDSGRRKVVIFLTDGRPEPATKSNDSNFMTDYLAGLETTIAEFAARGWPVHTVGLGNQPDQALLRDFALDTGGAYYRVTNPADLTGVFASILTEAKGLYLGAKYDRSLASGSSADTITVDAFTRAMTVVAVGRQGQPVQVSASFGGVAVVPGSDGCERRTAAGYDALVVGSPKAGPCEISITGTGDATLLVLYDKTIRLDMLTPAANARQLVGRSLALAVRLSGARDSFKGTVVAHILRPGTTIAEDVTLSDDGKHGDGAAGDGVFGNTWAGVHTQGDYRVLIEALQDKAPVASRSLQIYGESLPIMVVDAPATGTHYRGERMILAAHFAMAGLPIPPAETSGLTVKAEVTPAGGTPTVIPMADQGNALEGDQTAGDGVFSAVFIPGSEGDHQIKFTADGTLRGQAYHDEITLPTVPVAQPVFVRLSQARGSVRVAPGGSGKLAIELSSESETDETIEVSLLSGGVLTAAPTTVTIPAKGRGRAELVLEAAAGAQLGQQEITVICTGRAGVAFDPPTMPATVRIGRSNLLAVALGVAGGLVLLLVCLFCAYTIGGRALYAAALRKAYVDGQLSWSGQSNGELDLRQIGRAQVSIGGPSSDVVLSGCDAPVLFRIRTRLITIGSPVRLGWASLGGKLSFGCEVVAEGDARVSFRDFPKGLERLFHEDEFRCGEFTFRYENSKLPPRPRRGA